MAGDEIVSVKCKTCATTQTYRSAVERPKVGRRVVDMAGVDPSPRPRSKGPRRVLSSTGRNDSEGARRGPMPTPPPVPAGVEAPRAPARVTAKDEDLRRRWDALTEGRTSRHGRPHRATDSYRDGQIILHSAHGMGVIEGIAADGTLRVLFRRGYEALPSQVAPLVAGGPAAAQAK